MRKKKVLITGLWGLLGQNLLRVMRADYDITGIDLAPAPAELEGSVPCHAIDITDNRALAAFFKTCAPDIIINTAAMTNVDGCEREREKAEAVNHLAVSGLLQSCGSIERFVQISTDYVFDGENGPYSDDALPNPVSWYGETKLRAEKAAQNSGKPWLVVRTMVLYGTGAGLRPDFPTWVRQSLLAGKTIPVVTDQVGNITLAANLAFNIMVCLKANVSGVISLAGSDIMTRHAIACRIAEYYGISNGIIKPIVTAELHQPAPRPLKSGFMLDRARKIPGLRFLTFDEQLKEYENG